MGFPKTMSARVRYVEQIATLDAPILGVASYVFRLNSLHDPNFTGVGHKPMGMDEYNALYAHYQVLGCKYRVLFNSTGSTQHIVGCAIRRTSNTETPTGKYEETGDCQWKGLAQENGSPAMTEIKGNVNIAKWLGKQSSDDQLESLTGASPTEQMFLHVFTHNVSQGDPANVNFQIQLDFDSVFREKKVLTQS
ncbi:hypothetical protein N9Z56_01265 [bacterium]|nr:hypothetical protein [bacterium]